MMVGVTVPVGCAGVKVGVCVAIGVATQAEQNKTIKQKNDNFLICRNIDAGIIPKVLYNFLGSF